MSGPHIKDGEFVSDKFAVRRLGEHGNLGVDVTVGSFVLRFTDPIARKAIRVYATLIEPVDRQLSEDLLAAVAAAELQDTEGEA